MEWVLQSPQIHSTFSNLGYIHADGYHVNENCNEILEAILHNITTEDKYLRTYRRNISFGQNIHKDFIPLLLHAKDDKTIELLVKILVNLTIPVECLLSVNIISRNDFGRQTIFEINNLLSSTKRAFTDYRATRAIIEFLKKNLEPEQKAKVTTDRCTNISNCLLLLRNILHIPEDNARIAKNSSKPASFPESAHSAQNQILWNLFSQSIDKILIKLMTVPDAYFWGVTMVQLVALLYRDQHVDILQQLINTWFESSSSVSSTDNESNTSPLGRDPTSDSSDSGTSGKSNDEANSWGEDHSAANTGNGNQTFIPEVSIRSKKGPHNKSEVKFGSVENTTDTNTAEVSTVHSRQDGHSNDTGEKKLIISEASDCGYGTQIENQETISTSTSSTDDEPAKKPVHQKPYNPKQRANNKVRLAPNLRDRKKKKVAKRGRSKIINVQGLTHNTPSDDDIANVLKEFTVDFLLKGYNSLVRTLHNEILTNLKLEIDISHFFWLVTYFLKFASQIELDLQMLDSVLTFDIVSYLTAEGVNLCEQIDLDSKREACDLTPDIRRLHLVITSIREFVQALETYEKFTYLKKDDRDFLIKLQIKVCEATELRSLLVLLLRHYNPKYYSKQYLQDIIVTNHILLIFVDNTIQMAEYDGPANLTDHMRQFASQHVMYQYGILLEDYMDNGQFVNDCIFTILHHVSGDLDSLITLFQPKIISAFSSIWHSDFEMCDDWTDLIDYVVNTFIKKPETLKSTTNIRLETECFEEGYLTTSGEKMLNITSSKLKRKVSSSKLEKAERWTKEEISSLCWMYLQCELESDSISKLSQVLREEGVFKSKESIIMELHSQKLIDEDRYQTLMKSEGIDYESAIQSDDDIFRLRDQISKEGNSVFLEWVQGVLLETCRAKIYLEKKKLEKCEAGETKLLNFKLFKKKPCEMPDLSPVAYHALVYGRSVPLVPWNCKEASICQENMKFFKLLHKLGFHSPVDTGKAFFRIPHFWTADYLYEVAGKIWPIDQKKLKFCTTDLSEINTHRSKLQKCAVSVDVNNEVNETKPRNDCYQVTKEKHMATVVKCTPMPGSSNNSEAADFDTQNWLKLVQQSQEFKINLSKLGSFKEDENQPSVSPKPSRCDYRQQTVVSLQNSPLLIPHMSFGQDIPHYSNIINDTKCQISICETASVASDLTRMYVSDEEERADDDKDMFRRPSIQESILDDMDEDMPTTKSIHPFDPSYRQDLCKRHKI